MTDQSPWGDAPTAPEAEILQRLIQEGGLETPPWLSLAREMRRFLRASNVEIFFHRNEGEQVNLTAARDSENRPPDLTARYIQSYRNVDPLPYFTMEPGRVYLLEELLGDLSRNVFYQEFMRPAGLHQLMMCYVRESGGYRGWISVARRDEEGAFSAREIAHCRWIAAQLRSALVMFAALKQLEVERDIYANAFRRLHIGYLLLDQRGQLIRMDDEAARLLAQSRQFYLSKGNLRIRHTEKNKELMQIIAAGLACQARDFSRAINVPGARNFGLLICSAPMPAAPVHASDVDPRLVIYLNEPTAPDAAPQARIAELFDLSPSEAVLVAELVRGRTLAEAAAAMRITEHTARNYSKRIFSKTGTHRQAELVRLILTSVALMG